MLVRSTRSDVSLELTACGGEYVDVSITRHDLTARHKVTVYTDPDGIARFFRSMAYEWRGWSGSKTWESLEGELRLSASRDSVGHVFVAVGLMTAQGAPDPWRVEAELTIEAGMLEQVATDAEALFSQREV